MRLLFMTLGAFCAVVACHGADVTTKSGEMYKNYQILGGNETRIVVAHDGGESVVLVEDWPDELRHELPGQQPEPEVEPKLEVAPVEEFKVAPPPVPVLVTATGREYRDYQISGTSADGVVVVHETGMATISVEEWPVEKSVEIATFLEEIQHKQSEREAAQAREAKELQARYGMRFMRDASGRVYDLGAASGLAPGQALSVTGTPTKDGDGAMMKVSMTGYTAGDEMTPPQPVQYTVVFRIGAPDLAADAYGKTTTLGLLIQRQTGALEYMAEQLKPLEAVELMDFLKKHRLVR